MSDKIKAGQIVKWYDVRGGWCELLVTEGVTDEGTFSGLILSTKGYEDHLNREYGDWLPEYVK